MSDSNQPRSLSVVEVANAMVACRANAAELMEEADILSGAGRNARAYALIHTASEELAKFFMFVMAGKRVAVGDPPDWKRLWRRLRNHDSKIAHADVRLRYMMMSSDDMPDDEVLGGLAMLRSYGLIPRNASLYVEPAPNDSFRKPSDIDWSIGLSGLKATVGKLLRAAEEVGTTVHVVEKYLHQPSADRDRSRLLNCFDTPLSSCAWRGFRRKMCLGHGKRC